MDLHNHSRLMLTACPAYAVVFSFRPASYHERQGGTFISTSYFIIEPTGKAYRRQSGMTYFTRHNFTCPLLHFMQKRPVPLRMFGKIALPLHRPRQCAAIGTRHGTEPSPYNGRAKANHEPLPAKKTTKD